MEVTCLLLLLVVLSLRDAVVLVVAWSRACAMAWFIPRSPWCRLLDSLVLRSGRSAGVWCSEAARGLPCVGRVDGSLAGWGGLRTE